MFCVLSNGTAYFELTIDEWNFIASTLKAWARAQYLISLCALSKEEDLLFSGLLKDWQ